MSAFIKKNYCWVIAASVLVCYAVRAGVTNNLSGLYLIPVSEGLGVSRTEVSLTTSIRSIGTFLSNLSFGLVFSRLGFRKMAAIGIAVMGLAVLGLASSQSVLVYGACCFCLGLAEASYSTAAISRCISDWFRKYKGLVLGVVTAASGLGASLFAIILSGVIKEKGWRASQYLAGTLVLIAAAWIFLVTRDKPADMGTTALGEGENVKEKEKKKKTTSREGFEPGRLMKSPVFYLLLFSTFFLAMCAYAPYHILYSHLVDKGVENASRIQSLMFILLAVAKVMDGTLSDAVGAKKVVVFSSLCTGTACLLLTRVSTFAGALLPTVLVAVGLPMTTLLVALSTAEIVGSRSYDRVIGLMLATCAVANMVINPIMNRVYDSFGSYDYGLYGAAAAVVFAVCFYLFVCRLADRELEKQQGSGFDRLTK